VHRKLQPVKRTKMHGKPARVPSPWIDLKISVITILERGGLPPLFSIHPRPGPIYARLEFALRPLRRAHQ